MRLNWFVSPREGKQGPVRRVLDRLAPTWLASPLRRVVQTACFVTFLGLFCYVCWPYTARPARVWHGWLPVEVDAETGVATIAVDSRPTETPPPDTMLHVVDAGTPDSSYLGIFQITEVADTELHIAPVEPLTPEQLDGLSMSFGPWSLRESPPDAWPSHYADNLQAKEKQTLPADTFLVIDPLVSLSTALASRTWVWSLGCAGVILAVCLLIPRGFCGYVCPMGTLIDLSDWVFGRRVPWFRMATVGRLRWLKYCLLAATLVAAMFGVLLSGFVAAIPMLTRAAAYLITPLQTAAERGWHQVPPLETGQIVSIGLLLAVLGLGVLRPRFWCAYVCPTGAVFSVANLLRLTTRGVTSKCIGCGKCVDVCPFDAIEPDFSTRGADCTFCQTCGGVCPTRAIEFVGRWPGTKTAKAADDMPAVGRRGFMAAGVGAVASTIGGVGLAMATRTPLDSPKQMLPVRPPGSLPERLFLQTCIRCGECLHACPNGVLQPLGFKQGIEGLWTPHVVADWSGCESSCNNCGQVCPTGAIRALPLQEKKAARMGFAVVDTTTCLPYAGHSACQLCVDECTTAGYHAIEFMQVGTAVDELGNPIEGTGFLAPVVLSHLCVGCGLCQTRCYAINANEKRLLKQTAIRIEAGEGKEDRLTSGSYVALREAEEKRRKQEQQKRLEQSGADGGYLPEFLD